MNQPHWHVLGAGALGSLFAAGLARGGAGVTLVLRGADTASATVTIEDGDDSVQLALPVLAAGDTAPITHLLVCTKAYDVLDAVAGLAGRLAPGGVILLLVNGMGLAGELQRAWPRQRIYCGTTTEGAHSLAPRHVVHAGRGTTLIGREGETTPPDWFAQWSRATADCRWEPAIDAALWAKLAINCVINPLTALHRCRNGELAALAAEVDALLAEVVAVSNAAGYHRCAAALPQQVRAVIAGTAANRSSMLQDVEAGRRTEIDYITGYLLQVAGELGVDAPRNRQLLAEIKNLGD